MWKKEAISSNHYGKSIRKLDILHEYCDAIDGILKEFDGDSIDVDIDDIKMTICITVECEDLTIESKNINSISSWREP